MEGHAENKKSKKNKKRDRFNKKDSHKSKKQKQEKEVGPYELDQYTIGNPKFDAYYR